MKIFYWVMGVLIVGTFVPSVLLFLVYLITGDNGLGKSFLLDIAWWVLSRTWTGLPARPQPAHLHDAEIGFSFHGRAKRTTYVSRYDRFAQAWRGKPGRPAEHHVARA